MIAERTSSVATPTSIARIVRVTPSSGSGDSLPFQRQASPLPEWQVVAVCCPACLTRADARQEARHPSR
jgi:hypothetical protein